MNASQQIFKLYQERPVDAERRIASPRSGRVLASALELSYSARWSLDRFGAFSLPLMALSNVKQLHCSSCVVDYNGILLGMHRVAADISTVPDASESQS
jgi:hypothetical protein